MAEQVDEETVERAELASKVFERFQTLAGMWTTANYSNKQRIRLIELRTHGASLA